MPLGWQEGKGRRFAHHGPDGQLLGRVRRELAVEAEDILRVGQRMDDQPCEDRRPDRVQRELEAW